MQHFGTAAGTAQQPGKFGGALGIGNGSITRGKLPALAGEFFGLAVAGECEDTETVGVACDDIQCVFPDAACAAEYGERVHLCCPALAK